MPDRCVVTELLPDECAHCRRIPDPGREPAPARAVVTITAGYPGRCADCGEPFRAGATITADPEGHGWVADCCTGGADV
jgi:hypothetical protein